MKFVNKWLPIYIKCWIQLVWYHRDVYPRDTFCWTKYQGFHLPNHIPVNVNPKLQDYLDELCEDILSKLKHLNYFNLYICEYENENNVIERYCLDFGDLNHLDYTTGEEDQENLVFDEFRSSLFSLMAFLERLPRVQPGKYTFDIVIETVEMSLGHLGNEQLTNTKENMIKLERDWNWIKTKAQAQDFHTELLSQQRVKMHSLVGCDLKSLVFHQFAERVVLEGLDDLASSIE